jgi:hypothetical protein
MMVPADVALLLTPLASIDGVGDPGDGALEDGLGDFDGEAFRDGRAVAVGAVVGGCVWFARGATTTVPVMFVWMEQWYENSPCEVNRKVNDCCLLMVPESNDPSSAVTVWPR